jgi:hypothetical protein
LESVKAEPTALPSIEKSTLSFATGLPDDWSLADSVAVPPKVPVPLTDERFVGVSTVQLTTTSGESEVLPVEPPGA